MPDRPIRRHLAAMKRKGGERTRAKFAGRSVAIWSGEHRCWWRPNAQGYSAEFFGAGVYTFEDAWAATSHCDPDKRIVFHILPVGTTLANANALAAAAYREGTSP